MRLTIVSRGTALLKRRAASKKAAASKRRMREARAIASGKNGVQSLSVEGETSP